MPGFFLTFLKSNKIRVRSTFRNWSFRAKKIIEEFREGRFQCRKLTLPAWITWRKKSVKDTHSPGRKTATANRRSRQVASILMTLASVSRVRRPTSVFSIFLGLSCARQLLLILCWKILFDPRHDRTRFPVAIENALSSRSYSATVFGESSECSAEENCKLWHLRTHTYTHTHAHTERCCLLVHTTRENRFDKSAIFVCLTTNTTENCI